MAQLLACGIFVDEVDNHFPEEMSNVYLFNTRFIRKEPQGNGILDAFADVIRRASDLYPPIASHLITTSALNFVTANLLEHETGCMKVLLLKLPLRTCH